MDSLPCLRRSDEGTLLEVVVQPKASRNEIVGIHRGSLKIRLTAPPVEGEANRECIKFLAKAFRIPKSSIEIIQGHKSRQKTLLIREVPPETLESVLKQQTFTE
jgi:uncharacterized protein (TIGR00251 family)